MIKSMTLEKGNTEINIMADCIKTNTILEIVCNGPQSSRAGITLSPEDLLFIIGALELRNREVNKE